MANKLRNVRTAKRLLSAVFDDFMSDLMPESKAKTACYLLSTYVSMIKTGDIESRIELLEQKYEQKLSVNN